MEKDNSFRRAFYHLKMSRDYFNDVLLDFPLTIGGKASKRYLTKLDWILNDFATEINFPSEALQSFKDEMGGDLLFHETISQLCINLKDEQKRVVENMLELLINGHEITYEIKKPDA